MNDPEFFKKTLNKYFGKKTTQKLLKRAQKGEWEYIKSSHNSLRCKLIFKSLKNSPVNTFINPYKFVYMHLKEWISLKNVFLIAFIGPDGSGKSTLSRGLMESSANIFEQIFYYHSRYDIFPEIKNIIPGKKSDEISESDTRKFKEPSRSIKQLLMVYYGCEHIIGYYKLFLNRRKKTLFVFDRYYYDYVLQSNKIGLDNIVFRLFLKLIPTPDLVIYPHSTTKSIYERKPELSINEIEQQAEICKKIVEIVSNSYRINNNKPVNEVISEIKELMLSKVGNKLFHKK